MPLGGGGARGQVDVHAQGTGERDPVVACATVQHVVATFTAQRVVTVTAVYGVVAASAFEQVVAGAAEDEVVALAAAYIFDVAQGVGANGGARGGAGRQVDVDRLHAVGKGHEVGATAAVERVVAGTAAQRLGGVAAQQHVAKGRSEHDVDVDQGVGAAVAVAGGACGQIDSDRRWRAEVVGPGTVGAAVERVIAGITVQKVVAGAAAQQVIAGAPEQQVVARQPLEGVVAVTA
jgi:hypothetical protein